MSLCFTPEAPKRTSFPRTPECTMDKKRRRVKITSLSFPSPTPSSSFSSSPSPCSSLSSSSSLSTTSSSFPISSPPSRPFKDIAELSFLGQNYNILRILGEGDFGDVKEVQSRSNSEKFAIKISKVDRMKIKTGLNYTRMHLEEVRVHSSIPSHHNLLKFYQAWKEDGFVYMKLELCEDSLDGYWRKKNVLTQEEIYPVLRDMILALGHLSWFNFAHLDVKPGNILRCSNGSYKLADFSVTIDLNTDKSSSGEFGDGRYAAPELLSNQFTPKADLFSLAISLSQVSVPAESPLSSDEWSEMKEEGKLPDRVNNALSGPLKMNETVQSMLLPLSSRPSAEDIDIGQEIDSTPESIEVVTNVESPPRKRDRLSLSPSTERELRENASPLVRGNEDSVIFNTDKRFFEMERSKVNRRASLGGRKMCLRFVID